MVAHYDHDFHDDFRDDVHDLLNFHDVHNDYVLLNYLNVALSKALLIIILEFNLYSFYSQILFLDLYFVFLIINY